MFVTACLLARSPWFAIGAHWAVDFWRRGCFKSAPKLICRLLHRRV